MRGRILALALLAVFIGGATRPGGGSGRAASQHRERAIGIQPSSPDINVAFGNPAQFVLTTAAAITAGSRHRYFFRPLDELGSADTKTIMDYMGHPVAITLSFFVTGGSGLQTSDIPASCIADWTSQACRDDSAALVRPFAKSYLQSGDALLVGNEHQDFLDSAAKIAAHTALVLAIQEAVWSQVPGVYVGPVFSHNTADEAAITAAWDDRFSLLCLNAYGEESDFTVLDPIAQGIASVVAASDFAPTLTNSWSICETGWPGPMTAGGATLLGSSEAEQATWATALRSHARSSPARWIGVFIGNDGVLESDGTSDSNDGAGAISSKCCAAGAALSGQACNLNIVDSYICSLGMREADGTAKDAWDALWGL